MPYENISDWNDTQNPILALTQLMLQYNNNSITSK